MQEMIDKTISWPTLPMSVLLIVCCFYWLMVILGMFDLDIFDLDLDTEIDASSPIGIGFVGLRFLNIGNVPLMLWLSVFGLSGWLISMLLANEVTPVEWREIATAIGRNVGLALVATKIITQPLRGRFDPIEPHRSQDLLGQQCVVTSTTASPEFGQARYVTEAAPLILTIRTASETLPRDTVVEIIDYLPERSTYIVKAVHSGQEV